MKITCPSCDAKYSIADEKVQGKVAKIRCKKCGATIVVGGQGSEAVAAPSVPEQAVAAASGGGSYTVSISDADQRTMTLQEVVDAYNSGEVTGETYVWADGMDDWQPLAGVQEIISALHGAPPAAGSLQLPDPPPSDLAPVPAPAVVQQPVAATAARRESKAKGVDLFGGASSAGREEVVRQSSPPMMSGGGGGGESLTGARNEQSVLFSLNALASASTAQRPSGNASASGSHPAKPTEDSGLIDLGALARAAAEQPSGAVPALSAPVFGAPVLGAPMLGAPDLSAPGTSSATMPPPQKSKTGLFVGGAVVLSALLIAGAIVLKGNPPPPPPAAPVGGSATATATEAPSAATAPPTSTAVDPTATSPSATASTVAKPIVPGPLPKGGPKPAGAKDPPPGKADPPATPPPPKPPSGGGCGCAPSDLMCNMKCSASKKK